jgi:hypothetical protein
MANKQSFTPEEWTKVMESVMMAGVAVTAAEPSGLWGTMKEAFASGTALAGAKVDANSTDLVKAVMAELETSEGRTATRDALKTRFEGAKAPDIVARSVATLQEVSGILDAKAGADAAPFKALLVAIAEKVANASKEGGFLGFGGERVSPAEQASLDQIKAALA